MRIKDQAHALQVAERSLRAAERETAALAARSLPYAEAQAASAKIVRLINRAEDAARYLDTPAERKPIHDAGARIWQARIVAADTANENYRADLERQSAAARQAYRESQPLPGSYEAELRLMRR